MTYQILGRAIKNEHLALGVLVTAFTGGFLATRGGASDKQALPKGATVKQARESVPISAGSSEEEAFIKNFIAEAEKEGSSSH